MRRRGETRAKSAWARATSRLGSAAPDTTIDPLLRSVCMRGEKAISLIARPGGPMRAHFGTPLEPEAYVAWRVHAVSIYLSGDLPVSLDLRLGPGATIVAHATWA